MYRDGNSGSESVNSIGARGRAESGLRYLAANHASDLRNVLHATAAEFERLIVSSKTKVTFDIWVTPNIARVALAHGRAAGDRGDRDGIATKHARTMAAGGWWLFDQGPAFDWNGERVNGQTRYEAVIKAGVAVPMAVTFGVPPKVFALYDPSNAGRKPADLLRMSDRELTYYKWRATWINDMGLIEYGSSSYFGGDELIAAVSRQREAFDWTLEHMRVNKSPIYCAPICAAVAYAYPVVERRVIETFVHGYETGEDLRRGSPVLYLRNYSLGRGKSGGRHGTVDRDEPGAAGPGARASELKRDSRRVVAGKALRCILAHRDGLRLSLVRPEAARSAIDEVKALRAKHRIQL